MEAEDSGKQPNTQNEGSLSFLSKLSSFRPDDYRSLVRRRVRGQLTIPQHRYSILRCPCADVCDQTACCDCAGPKKDGNQGKKSIARRNRPLIQKGVTKNSVSDELQINDREKNQ